MASQALTTRRAFVGGVGGLATVAVIPAHSATRIQVLSAQLAPIMSRWSDEDLPDDLHDRGFDLDAEIHAEPPMSQADCDIKVRRVLCTHLGVGAHIWDFDDRLEASLRQVADFLSGHAS